MNYLIFILPLLNFIGGLILYAGDGIFTGAKMAPDGLPVYHDSKKKESVRRIGLAIMGIGFLGQILVSMLQ